MENQDKRLSQIADAVRKTGFVLEREVSDLFETFNWSVINNRYYIDAVTNAPREIDLLAYKTFSYEDIRHYFVTIVSCKKSESNDWVFLTKPSKEYDPNLVAIPQLFWTNSEILKVTDTISTIEKSISQKSVVDNEFKDIFGLDNNVYAFQEVSIVSGKPQNDKPIYSSIDSLLMASSYELKSIKDKKKENLIYHFNLLTVFDGDMYEALITKDEPVITKIDHSKYVNRFIIDNIESFCRLHFCKKEKLPEMLYELGKLYEYEQVKIIERIDEYKTLFLDNDIYRNTFRKEILGSLSPIFTMILQDYTPSEITKIEDLWLEKNKLANELNIEINASEDVIRIFNSYSYLIQKTKELLKTYCRYIGDFKYKQMVFEDTPF